MTEQDREPGEILVKGQHVYHPVTGEDVAVILDDGPCSWPWRPCNYCEVVLALISAGA